MAQLTIIYWRDIPTQVVAKRGRKSEKRELPKRFIEAVDQAAMIAGAKDSDAYLAEWRRSDPTECGDDLAQEVASAAHALDATFDHQRLVKIAKNGGWDAEADGGTQAAAGQSVKLLE